MSASSILTTVKLIRAVGVALGLIDWHPYLPRLFSQLQWAFQVPVGTASATPPFGKLASLSGQSGRVFQWYIQWYTQLTRHTLHGKQVLYILSKCA